MRSAEWDDALIREHRDYIQDDAARGAFDTLVRHAEGLPGFECGPGWHGDIRDFFYVDAASGERPFAFIVNRSDLLFYARRRGTTPRVPGGFEGLRHLFQTAGLNPSGEWTVRIGDTAAANRLIGLLFASSVTPGGDWTEAEIRILVADYFDMLRMERKGLPYSKAAHNAQLQSKLPCRSRGSIEYKHQNVSGVLYDENFPFLDGYKPARNYQRRLLPDIVLEVLGSGGAAVTAIEQAAESVIEPPWRTLDFSACETAAPELETAPAQGPTPRVREARKYDYAARDASNRKLGRAGEEFILQRERWYLRSIGRDDLSQRLEWVADTRGDGLGYDLISFCPNTEHEIYIEVKTTNSDKRFPFYVTPSEIAVSGELGDRYRLARVFNFSLGPRFYSVTGSLTNSFHLSPKLFEARR